MTRRQLIIEIENAARALENRHGCYPADIAVDLRALADEVRAQPVTDELRSQPQGGSDEPAA